MFRLAFLLSGVVGWCAAAPGQGIRQPYVPPQVPAPPLVVIPQSAVPVFQPGVGGFGSAGVPVFAAYLPGGYYGFPGVYGFPYLDPYSWYNPAPLPRAPLTAPAATIPNIVKSNEPDWLTMSLAPRPAELTVQLPAEGEVWQDGQLVPGSGSTRVLTSPPIKPGGMYTFHLRMRWTINDTAYESERATEVAPGEVTRLAIFAGTPISK